MACAVKIRTDDKWENVCYNKFCCKNVAGYVLGGNENGSKKSSKKNEQ